MTIATILGGKGREVDTVDAGQTVASVVALLAERRIGAVPVTRDGRLVGIFSERDVIYGLAASGSAVLDRQIAEVMTAPAVTVSTTESAIAALALMTLRRIRHLPVVDGEELVGIVSIGDLVKHRIERIEAEANAMRDYIQSA